ncbi:MAG: hypothetical protein ACR2OH_09340 [Microthrixaceae bacterium]
MEPLPVVVMSGGELVSQPRKMSFGACQPATIRHGMALTRAGKRINAAIDADDHDKLRKALEKSNYEIGDAIDSQQVNP